jgi:tryptophanyl-tRNA synthetase
VRLSRLGVRTFIVIADYQVLTDRDTFEAIGENIRQLTIDYISAGLDPHDGKTCIFPQATCPS